MSKGADLLHNSMLSLSHSTFSALKYKPSVDKTLIVCAFKPIKL